jgi:hypothetical protein
MFEAGYCATFDDVAKVNLTRDSCSFFDQTDLRNIGTGTDIPPPS